MQYLRAGIWVACVASVVLLAAETARAGDEDILGGDSIATDFDVFIRDDLAVTWRVEVSSFVYDSTSDEVPEGMPEPGGGQTLFAYLLENTGNDLDTDIAVTDFSIGNPDSLPLLAFDAGSDVEPDDLDEDDRSDPRNFFENTQSVAYNWQDVAFPPPATMELLIGQWSVVFFLVDGTFADQNGSVIAGGISDSHTILGPMIPEPTTLLVCLVGVGALTMTRRRNRRTTT